VSYSSIFESLTQVDMKSKLDEEQQKDEIIKKILKKIFEDP
jgi:hypothetical protein